MMAGLKPHMLATTDPGTSGIDRRSGKSKRVGPKIRKAVRLILEGKATTFRAAAEGARCAPETLSRAFSQTHVRVYVAEQLEALKARGAMLAMPRLLELLRSGSEHVSLDAVKHALAIEGIRPADSNQAFVNVNVSPGYVIDLELDPRDVTPVPAPAPRPARSVPSAQKIPTEQQLWPDLHRTGVDRWGNTQFSYFLKKEEQGND